MYVIKNWWQYLITHHFPNFCLDAGVWVAQDARHHRHWQEVLAQIAGLHLSTVRQPLPASGSVLGGTMELHGQHISLACFHGINFKSKSWALFSLKEPCISFTTEAQEVHPSECNYFCFIFIAYNFIYFSLVFVIISYRIYIFW